MERIVRWLALVVSFVAFVILWFMPTYAFRAVSESVSGDAIATASSDTLIGVNGYAVLAVLAIPVLAALSAVLPWPAKYRRGADILAALVSLAFCLLGAFTVGLFFLPAAALLLFLAVWPRPRRPAT